MSMKSAACFPDKPMITTASNQQMKQITALLGRSRERAKSGLFVAEGSRMVRETPPRLIERLYFSESFSRKEEAGDILRELGQDGKSPEPVIVADSVFARMSDTVHPQGICALVKQPRYELSGLLAQTAEKSGLLLILENIQDPGNLGTMLRTAEAAGACGVLMSSGCVDLFNPKVIRSTMGAVYRLPFSSYEDMALLMPLLREHGIHTLAACLHREAKDYTKGSYQRTAAILIGNEGNGLLPATIEASDEKIQIPMDGKTESLNAAVSAAVLLYEARRQRTEQV